MMHKACTVIEEVPYCFSRSSVEFQGHTGQKIADFVILVRIDGFERMQNTLSSIEKVPYCFSMSSIKCQSHTDWKIDDWQF